MPAPKKILLIAACTVIAITTAWWGSQGAHRGWSQNRVPVSQTDEITGITYTTYEERFVPGVDVLLLGLAIAAGLGVSTFLVRKPKTKI